ncbi:MAG: hypothetical protein OXU23_26585 [Candidatus Poribacteria bacterium]|nr:hypothetical protein [Candidatus Poribacteria bacterium]
MKPRAVFFKGVYLACILTLLSWQFQTVAENSDITQAISDATRDGKNAPNSYIWFPAGCFLGVAGILIAAIYSPTPPTARLLGKSPEYVAYYTQTYQNVARDDQMQDAVIGCFFSHCLLVGAYL